jgi:hypothetical protein
VVGGSGDEHSAANAGSTAPSHAAGPEGGGGAMPGASGPSGSSGSAGGALSSQSQPAAGTSAIGPPKSGAGAMPYHPANVLRWSESPPASSPSGDRNAPSLQRILEVTKPDDEQKQKILDLWSEHENQRRALLAAAPSRASGPPIPDRMKSAENDFKFESTLLSKILRRDQMDRIVPEIYPPRPKR